MEQYSEALHGGPCEAQRQSDIAIISERAKQINASRLTAKYTKLDDGKWGVRVRGIPKVGDHVRVQKRDGSFRRETVKEVLWSGSGVSICTVA